MFCAYADYEMYGLFVENDIKNTFIELVPHAIRDSINTQSYRKRALLLNCLCTKKAY